VEVGRLYRHPVVLYFHKVILCVCLLLDCDFAVVLKGFVRRLNNNKLTMRTYRAVVGTVDRLESFASKS